MNSLTPPMPLTGIPSPNFWEINNVSTKLQVLLLAEVDVWGTCH